MIPRKIHYCWFGGNPLPDDVKKYIASWKKHCPDYEVIEWNEQNFDISCNDYVKEAYEAKKWAFVTDYVRLYALYHHGGIYIDTDVEVVKSLDKLLAYNAVIGYESETCISTAVIMACRYSEYIGMLLTDYDNRHFLQKGGSFDMTTNVKTITRLTAEKYGLILNGITKKFGENMILLPFEYLCAKSFTTGKLKCTNDTFAIHHFSGSWLSDTERIRDEFRRHLIPFFGGYVSGKIAGLYYYFLLGGVSSVFKRIIFKLNKNRCKI